MAKIRKSFKIYSVRKNAKVVASPQERAKGILLLSELGFEVFPNFGGN